MKTFEQFKAGLLKNEYDVRLKFSLEAAEKSTSVVIEKTREFKGKDALGLLNLIFAEDVAPRIKTLYAAYLEGQVKKCIDAQLAQSQLSLLLPGDEPDACCGDELPYAANYCPQCGKPAISKEERVTLDSTVLVRQHYAKLPQAIKARIKALAYEACPEWAKCYMKFLAYREPLVDQIVKEMGI